MEKSPSFPQIKQSLLLNLSRETTLSEETLPDVVECEETLPGVAGVEVRRRRSSIVYEENIPVVVRRRGVTMTVRIFGADDTEGTTAIKGLPSDLTIPPRPPPPRPPSALSYPYGEYSNTNLIF